MSQSKAWQALKNRALESPPTRVLFDEIRTHKMGLEATLAAVTILWCQDGSVAMRLKENLKTDLRKSIDESNNVLTTTTAGPVTASGIISAQLPSEDLSRKRTTHTDINNRRGLYPLLGRV